MKRNGCGSDRGRRRRIILGGKTHTVCYCDDCLKWVKKLKESVNKTNQERGV